MSTTELKQMYTKMNFETLFRKIVKGGMSIREAKVAARVFANRIESPTTKVQVKKRKATFISIKASLAAKMAA